MLWSRIKTDVIDGLSAGYHGPVLPGCRIAFTIRVPFGVFRWDVSRFMWLIIWAENDVGPRLPSLAYYDIRWSVLTHNC